MNRFYVGLHHPSVAWPFRSTMISVNTLMGRRRAFRVNNWILDSGAFSQLSRFGRFTMSRETYLKAIAHWSKCGKLDAAVAQDWMCEEMILAKTGLSIAEHQQRSIESYAALRTASPEAYIMPVLQGFAPTDYVRHLRWYGNLLPSGAWTGVGSICRRNSDPDQVEDVLLAIKSERSDLRLHGFGLKITALERGPIRALLESSDSMAWSYHGRRNGQASNDPRIALEFVAKIEPLVKTPCFMQTQLFDYWHEH